MTPYQYMHDRAARGEATLDRTWGDVPGPGERESAAADAVSDILTALFGIAGRYSDASGEWKYVDHGNEERARAFLDRGLRSYMGDAQDYDDTCTVAPTGNPGTFGNP